MKFLNSAKSTASKAILVGALLMPACPALAQLRADLGHGSAMLEESVRLFEKDEKQKALDILATVNRNDTLYERVLQTRMEIHANLDQYEATKALALEGIALKGSRSGTFLIMHAAVLLDLKEYQQAAVAADVAAAELPGLFRPRHLKVLALAGMEDKKAALEMALENARRFPYRREAHILLGSIAHNEGNTAEAALALAMAQIVRFEDKTAEDILVYYDAVLGDRQVAKPGGYDMRVTGDDFSEELLLIKSKAAMDKKYKVKPDLTYPMCRQSHLLFTLVQENKDDKGGYRSLYAPIIRAIMDQNMFEGFVYHCLASSNDPKIKAVAVKNKSKVEDFRQRIGGLLRNTVTLFPDTIGGPALLHRFNNNGDLASVGTGNPNDREFTGNWTFFHANGRRSALGTYDAQARRTGTWYNWYDTGILKSKADLVDGELDGPWINNHPNGARLDSAMMRAGQRTGMVCTHYSTGGRHRCKTAVDDMWEGAATEYFQSGILSWEYDMSKDKFQGSARQYFPDGSLRYEGEFLAGDRVGTHKNNHSNGKPKDEFTMVAGQANGPFRKFFANGQLYEEGTMKNDRAVGERRNYDEWGTLVVIDRLDDTGRNQGVREDLNSDGNRHIEFEYNKDLLVRYKYYDRSGKLLGEGTRSRGKFDLKGYHADGELRVQGTYLDEGAKDGTWKYFYRDGTIESEESHNKGKQVGTASDYDKAGKLESTKVIYERNGNTYSALESFYPSGVKKNEGQRKSGEQEGELRRYYPDGKLETIEYYVADSRSGWQVFYDPAGILHYAERFENGAIAERVSYDDEGKEYERVVIAPGPFELVTHHPQGALASRLSMMNGFLHGPCKWYYSSGKLELEGTYLNGRRHGKWTGYHPNGKKSSEREYHIGVQNGQERKWYHGGEPSGETIYVDGEMHGVSKQFHRNGKVSYLREYENDEYHGRHVSYTPDGQVMMVRFYHKGRLTGYGSADAQGNVRDTIPATAAALQLESKFPNGQVARRFNYRNGELHGLFQEYHANGQLMEETEYQAGDVSGNSTEYHSNGKVMRTTHYVDGLRHGEEVIHWDNGQPRIRTTYTNGEIHGPQMFYDRTGKLEAQYRWRADSIVEIIR